MANRYSLALRSLCTLAVACCLTAPAIAAEPITLQSEVKAEKTVVEDGVAKTVLVAADSVVPGDRLLFSTTFTNSGADSVEDFVLTNPLPAAVTLAPGQASTLLVSVDGGKTFARLSELSVKAPDGTDRPAQASDVTHVRAIIESIAAGSGGTFAYYAIVR